MTPQELEIIDQIKIHFDQIKSLMEKLSIPTVTKSKKGIKLTDEEMRKFDERLAKSLYKQ